MHYCGIGSQTMQKQNEANSNFLQGERREGIDLVLSPLCNSWLTLIIKVYIALNRTLHTDCYRVGTVPKV